MSLPDWVVQPLDMKGAALALGISERTLFDALKIHPHYELRGRKKVFYPEHISQLRRDLNKCASRSNGSTVGPISTGPVQTDDASGNLSKLVTLAERRKSARR